jgi:hypothetical protein
VGLGRETLHTADRPDDPRGQVKRRASARPASEVQSLSRYPFCSSFSISFRRMNRAATFLAVGDAPAMEPVFALGARGTFSPCCSV